MINLDKSEQNSQSESSKCFSGSFKNIQGFYNLYQWFLSHDLLECNVSLFMLEVFWLTVAFPLSNKLKEEVT